MNFVFAGKGEFAEEIRNIHNAAEVGFRTGADLNKLIKGAYCTVYPSEWYENNPFSVMESQEQLVPVIGANIGGIPELINVGKTGELFESGNCTELKIKIESLYRNKELTQQYSSNCKEIAFDDIDTYVKKLMDIYKGSNKEGRKVYAKEQ